MDDNDDFLYPTITIKMMLLKIIMTVLNDYLHPSRYIVPLCAIGDSTGEIVTRCAPGKNILCTWQKYLVRFFHGFRVELVKCRLNMGRSTQCICLDLKSNLDTFSPDVSTHDAVAVWISRRKITKRSIIRASRVESCGSYVRVVWIKRIIILLEHNLIFHGLSESSKRWSLSDRLLKHTYIKSQRWLKCKISPDLLCLGESSKG